MLAALPRKQGRDRGTDMKLLEPQQASLQAYLETQRPPQLLVRAEAIEGA